MWLMKTLLTSWCINQRGAGHRHYYLRKENSGEPANGQKFDLCSNAVLAYHILRWILSCDCIAGYIKRHIIDYTKKFALNISNNIMITHFTNEFEKLLSIISSNSFLLRYCGEYFGDKNGKVVSNAAHPMVSFSGYDFYDLPTKRITYGGYGISLHKNWAINNGITPVNYIDKNSPVALGLIALLRSRQLKKLPRSLRLPVIQLKCFTKHVYGYNSYFSSNDYDFEYEKEWRYVPTTEQIKKNLISINLSAYERRKDFYNNKIKNFSLKFSYDDVRCIYVQNEYERNKIMLISKFTEGQVIIAPWRKNK
ncbi:hypothetical protein AI2937V1_1837 [Klebsiella oxytoca]|nr:hypothetical protein AI2937V1_1837 [Klebsiella oxytoca]CAH6679929.1 hypothetical protein AI2937V1_1837 [Klebsiella oxytoca]